LSANLSNRSTLRNMALPDSSPPRARVGEARRNRQTLINVATRAFASGSPHVSLAAIAAESGVGIGTLYRHFPTRQALVEAVYHDQVGRLRIGAQDLLSSHPPAEAFRLWMDLFCDWAATKHGMIDTLRMAAATGTIGMGEMRDELTAVVGTFLDSGAAAGDIRRDVDAADVSAILAGILAVAGAPDQRDQARRMLDLITDGLRPR
jgi:AcrR family transcriptional regulator